MRREDYERLGAPCKVPKNYDAQFHLGRIKDVAAVSGELEPGENAVAMYVGIIIELRGLEEKAMVHLEKTTCDEIIRALIACRNHLWPGP